MAFTESANIKRQNISQMAQALSGAKQRTAELGADIETARKNRQQALMQQLMGTGADFLKQEKASQLAKEQFGYEQETMYGPGSSYEKFQMRLLDEQNRLQGQLAEKEAELKAEATRPESPYYTDPTGDIRAKLFLIDELLKDPERMRIYMLLERSGVPLSYYTEGRTKEEGGIDGQELMNAMYANYSYNADRQGLEKTQDGFRQWVDMVLSTNVSTGQYTQAQADAIMSNLDQWINVLFQGQEEPELPQETKTPLSGLLSPPSAEPLERLENIINPFAQSASQTKLFLRMRANEDLRQLKNMGVPREVIRKKRGEWNDLIKGVKTEGVAGRIPTEEWQRIFPMIQRLLGEGGIPREQWH